MISVIVTAWGRYASSPLNEAICSLLAQDVAAEVIVVDNASEPPIAPIAGCQVVRLEERCALGAARNRGLEAVTTPYTVFWDADDVMLPRTLRVMRHALEEAGETAVASACAIIDGSTGRRQHWPRRWAPALARRPRLFGWVNALWSQYPLITALVRTDAIRDCGGFPETDQGEDWALGAALAFRGGIVLLDHEGLWYRPTEESLSSGWRSFPHVSRNARLVRARLRSDAAVPGWVRASLPLMAALQLLIMLLVRPPARLGRRMRATGARSRHADLRRRQPACLQDGRSRGH